MGDNPWDTGGELAPSDEAEEMWAPHDESGDTGSALDTEFRDMIVPDIIALLPAGALTFDVNWGPTPDEIWNLLPINLSDVLKKYYEILQFLGVPFMFIPLTLLCATGMKIGDHVKILDTFVKLLQGNEVIDIADPCQIRRLAKVGNCVARRGLGISLVPDIQDFWIDGKAADPANLKQEVMQFPPDDRGVPTTFSYYPIDASWFFGRVGAAVEKWLALTQEHSVWEGVLERLQAPPETIFPPYSSGLPEEKISPLCYNVELGKGNSSFHTTGTDWIYPNETKVIFRYSEQAKSGFSSDQYIVDEELFMAGGMTVTSEVEVYAKPDILRVGEVDINGWTATIRSWRVRVSDRIDYHSGETQGLPLGPVDLELPDQLFLDLQSKGCPGYPTPVDFAVMTDAWHSVPIRLMTWPSLFISREPHEVGDSSPFGKSETYNYFDPESGRGVKPEAAKEVESG